MATPANPLTFRERTILVVDDEITLLDSIKELLAAYLDNVRVLAAPGGRQALELLEREVIDVLLVDYRMPEMNGAELLQVAKQKWPATPRILMTAYPELALAMRAVQESRIDNFLTKPFQANQLLEVVGAVLLDLRSKELRQRALVRALDAERMKTRAASPA